MCKNDSSFANDVSTKACRCYISEEALLAAQERQRLLADTVAISEVISEMVMFAYREMKKGRKTDSSITFNVTNPPA